MGSIDLGGIVGFDHGVVFYHAFELAVLQGGESDADIADHTAGAGT